MRVHIIRDGKVENTIIVDSLAQAQAAFPDATVIDGSVGGPGWVHSGSDVFPPAPEASDSTRVTRLAFRNRFTTAEKVAISLAARGNSPTGAALQVYLDDVASAYYVDLSRADTRAGVQALESGGLIAAGRAAQILDVPVTRDEEFRERP